MKGAARVGGEHGPAVNYLPNDIVVVVTDDGPTYDRTRYEGIARALNAEIQRLVEDGEDFSAKPGGVLADDLALTDDLRAYLSSQPEVLRPHPDAEGIRWEGPTTPWITLPPPSGKARSATRPAAATLCFYRVDHEPLGFSSSGAEPSADDLATHAQRTRGLVNLLQSNRDRLSRAIDGAGSQIVAVTPNWLTAMAPFTAAGPGARPDPLPLNPAEPPPPPGMWSVEFEKDDLAKLVDAQRARKDPSRVVVAVLDTTPTSAEVSQSAAAFTKNTLLQRVASNPRIHIDEPGRSPDAALFQPLDGVLPNWRDALEQFPTTDHFLMKDHGLFATGLIHDIVPTCEVHLLRVLSDYGVGDLWTLAATLMQLPTLVPNGEKLVVNLSLGVAVPPGDQLLRDWLPKTFARLRPRIGEHDNLQTAFERIQDAGPVKEKLDSLHAGIRVILEWLDAHPNILIVAAAGNDNDDQDPSAQALRRPEPRWPARYDHVFGVAAIDRAGQPSHFSNRGDVRMLGNGVATFGGDTSAVTAGGLGIISTKRSGDPDAVIGIFSAENLPFNLGQNRSGWVYWAGTSFATPIVSAVAAALWSEPKYADLSAQEIIRHVIQYFSDPSTSTDPDRLDCPTIPAHQEFKPA